MNENPQSYPVSVKFWPINQKGINWSKVYKPHLQIPAVQKIQQDQFHVVLTIKNGNMTRFLLVDQGDQSIYVEQVDIRSIQLAKAALSAGVSILMDYLECTEFDQVLLAGAFGAHLDARYVALLDIIPTATEDKIVSVGNAAGIGASAALLDVSKRKIIIDAVEKVVKIETATEPRFQEFFVDAMKFSVSPVKEQKTNKVRRRKRVP